MHYVLYGARAPKVPARQGSGSEFLPLRFQGGRPSIDFPDCRTGLSQDKGNQDCYKLRILYNRFQRPLSRGDRQLHKFSLTSLGSITSCSTANSSGRAFSTLVVAGTPSGRCRTVLKSTPAKIGGRLTAVARQCLAGEWRKKEEAKIQFTITVNWQREARQHHDEQLGTLDRGCRSVLNRESRVKCNDYCI